MHSMLGGPHQWAWLRSGDVEARGVMEGWTQRVGSEGAMDLMKLGQRPMEVLWSGQSNDLGG